MQNDEYQQPQYIIDQKKDGEALRQVELVVENSRDAIISETLEGIITGWNGGATKIFGYSAEEMIGKSVLLLYPPELKDELSTVLDKVKAGVVIADYDSARLHKDGSRINVAVSISPIKKDDGMVIGVSSIQRDITDFKKMEESLLQVGEDKYKELFSTSRDAIMTLEPPLWRFTSGNPAALKMFGVNNEEEFKARGIRDLSPEKQPDGGTSSERIEGRIKKAMVEGYNFFKWTHRRANGEEFPAEILLSRVKNQEKVFLQALVRDVTERKKAEDELKEHGERLLGESNEKFFIAFQTSPYAITITHIGDDKLIEVNDTFTSITGFTREEAITRSAPDLNLWVNTEDRNKIIGDLEKGVQVKNRQIQFRKKNGEIIISSFSAQIIHVNNEPLLLSSIDDITEQKTEEESLRQSKLIVENSHDAIIGETLEGIVTSWNGGANKMFGYLSDEMVGKSMTNLFPSELKDELPQLLERVKRGEVIADYDTIWLRKDTTRADVEFSLSPVYGGDGAIIGVSLVGRDISIRKKNERQIKELNEVRNKFISIISHQLRTPLTAVNWNLELILNGDFGKLEDLTRQFLQATHKESVEITYRIHDLLSAMDIEEGRVVLQAEEASLDSIVAAIMIEMGKKAELKGVSCQYIASEKDLPVLEVDIEKIRTVITKLVENSIIYTKEGGKSVSRLSMHDGTIRFEVTDTGIGIPAQEQHHIFTRFFRASNATAMQPDAFGLGLFLVQSFVKQHGGAVGFESKEGEGSTFWFEIPLKLEVSV